MILHCVILYAVFSQAVITEDAYPPGEHVHQAHFYWGQMHILSSQSSQKFILKASGYTK